MSNKNKHKFAAKVTLANVPTSTVVAEASPTAIEKKVDTSLDIVVIEDTATFDAATARSQFAASPTLTVFKMLFVLWVTEKMRQGASVFLDLKNWTSFHEFCGIVNVCYDGVQGSKSMYPRNIAGAIRIDYNGFAYPFYKWLLSIRNKTAQPVINGKRLAYDNGLFIVKFESTETFDSLRLYKETVRNLIPPPEPKKEEKKEEEAK